VGLVIALFLFFGARHRLVSSAPLPSWKAITKAVHLVTKLASDGRNVYWTEFDESGCKPWRVPVDGGGEAGPLKTPFANAFVSDASPDGRLLLIVRDYCVSGSSEGIQGPVWELTAASGVTRRVGSLIGRDAVFSPDGRHIALARWDELWLANRDGSEAHRIARVPSPIVTIHWSPDGKLLRLTISEKNGLRFQFWETEIETGKAAPMAGEWPDGADVLDGTWTGDGQFVFGARSQLGSDLWRLTPRVWPSSGHSIQQLTHGPLEVSQPAAIPGRSQLAVAGTQKQGELQRFDSRLQRFTPLLNGISAEMVDFSRDGKWAAYVTYPERELWRSRADGSAPLQLTHGSLRAGLPRISPDGTQVAFTGDYAGRDLRTWIVPIDGGAPRLASRSTEGVAEVAPTWSKDGTKLLFRLDLALQRDVLAVLDVASGKVERIPGSEYKFHQRWSPDGKWIVATSNSDSGLWIFDVRRGEWSSLSEMRADYLNWSRDSKDVYYSTELANGEDAIYRISLASRKPELVTKLAGTRRAYNDVYGQWVGLTPDDSPMILRSADLERIYLLSFSAN
jgi:Tol biopolymer transport system component